MANIKNNYSDYIKFYITSVDKPALLVENIIGWENYGLDSARNSDYHGTVNQVTKNLGFTGAAKDYLEKEYKEKGVLANVSLIVSRLEKRNDVLAWYKDVPVYADFYKRTIKDEIFNIAFNSNSLMDKIDAYEDEEFEIERREDFENNPISSFPENLLNIEGRSILSIGESRIHEDELGDFRGSSASWTLRTQIASSGPARNSAVEEGDFNPLNALNMFYVNSVVPVADNEVSVSYSIVGTGKLTGAQTSENLIELVKVQYNDVTASFDEIESVVLFQENGQIDDFIIVQNGNYSTIINQDQGLYIRISKNLQIKPTVYRIQLNEVASFVSSSDLRFQFVYDVIERLLYIITGQNNRLISRSLGRTEKGYIKDGEFGLIGTMSGLQARNFDTYSEKYTSPKFSIKETLDSVSNVFNLGYGVEKIDNVEYLVIEPLEYFYRKEIAGSFPEIVDNFEEKTDESSFYSGLQFGYEKGGGYENEMGLDEPNISSQFISPIYNTKGKFKKLSSIRADEYGMEVLRRTPQVDYPNESFSGDEDNWFLDLKRKPTSGFEQVEWQDRLEKEPTGIHSPETFRSMFFTPMTILKRLSSNFNSGLYLYKEKFVNFTSSSSNRTLSMQFIGDLIERKESDNFLISELNRPIFKNDKVTFTHAYSEELRALLFGKTRLIINGEEVDVPNYNLKFEFTNEDGLTQRGYFLKYEFEDNPTFEFQLANEEII